MAGFEPRKFPFRIEPLRGGALEGKALILGERACAQIIAAQLVDLGFEPIFPTDINLNSLPYRGRDSDFEELRILFREFQKISGKRGLVHPSTSPWAESPQFPALAQEFFLIPVTPSARVLSFFRNQLDFLDQAGKLGIPHLALSGDPMHSVREIQGWIKKSNQTYPFVLKGIKKGGNHTVFVVHEERAFEKSIPLWVAQLRKNFGEVILFAERYLEGARYIVSPFARFKNGEFKAFPLVDSTLQSRYRRMVELCPCPHLHPDATKKIIRWTDRLAEHCNFVGVGAFEFLVEDSGVYLIGGLPRLNSGFHLWERWLGTQAVRWQLATYDLLLSRSFGSLSNIETKPDYPRMQQGQTSMSLRIYAEDALLQLPQAGKVFELSTEREWDTENGRAELYLNFEEEESLSPFDSGMVGTLFITASSEMELFSFAREVLKRIWIAGTLQTNERFLSELIGHPWVQEGIFHAGFVDEEFLPAVRPPEDYIHWAACLCSWNEPLLLWIIGERFKARNLVNFYDLPWDTGPVVKSSPQGVQIAGSLKLGSDLIRVFACSIHTIQDRWMVRMGHWFFSARKSVPRGSSRS